MDQLSPAAATVPDPDHGDRLYMALVAASRRSSWVLRERLAELSADVQVSRSVVARGD